MRVAALFLLVAACTQPRSARCKDICKREGDCIDQVPAKQQMTFDEKECVAACSALETDNENVAKVARHADCVQKNAQNCAAVLECP